MADRGVGEEKKKGDWIILGGFETAYKIKTRPEVFLSNRLANEEEIEEAKKLL